MTPLTKSANLQCLLEQSCNLI